MDIWTFQTIQTLNYSCNWNLEMAVGVPTYYFYAFKTLKVYRV